MEISARLPNAPASNNEGAKGRGSNLRSLFVYLHGHGGTLVFGTFLALMQATSQWMAPWPLKMVIDNVIGRHHLPRALNFLPRGTGSLLVALSLATIAIAALQMIFSYGSNRVVAGLGQRVTYQIRTDLYENLLKQSISFHQRQRIGDMTERISSDIQAIQSVVVNAIPSSINNSVTLLGILVIMLFVSPLAAALALISVPALYLIFQHYMLHIKRSQREVRRLEGQLAAVTGEVLSSIFAVQAYGQESDELERVSKINRHSLKSAERTVILQSRFAPLIAFVMTISTTLVIFVTAQLALKSKLTAGDLLVILTYLRTMYTPIRQLAKLAGGLGRAEAAAERVISLLNSDESVPNATAPKPIKAEVPSIWLDSVSCSYGDSRPALSSVDLKIPAGAMVAVLGETGSGKSTLLKMIPRFLEPTTGRILISGIDVRELNLVELRALVSFVSQNPYVFSGTAWENIVYGAPTKDKQSAIRAARRAGVASVIEDLPNGYDTVLSEHGGAISGGQRQCIAIARAVSRQSRILLLDEPTTGLDPQTESILLDAIERVRQDKTTLFVTHQLTGATRADLVAVFDSGKLVEFGTHESLSTAGGTYGVFSRLQSQWFSGTGPT